MDIMINTENFYFGFFDNKKAMEQGKVQKTLDKSYKYDGIVMTRKQFIEKCLLEGSYVKHETNVIVWGKRGSRIQENYYSIHHINKNYYNEITKTEYDYFNYLYNNDYNTLEFMQKYITEETQRQVEVKRLQEEQEEREKQEKLQAEQDRKDFETWLKEQAEEYPKNEKYELLKEIYLSEMGNFYGEATRLLVLIDNIDNLKCKIKLQNWLHNGNTTSKKAFYYITGLKLPATNKETLVMLNSITSKDFQGMIVYKKRKSKQEEEIFYKLVRKGIGTELIFEEARGEKINKYGLDLFISKAYKDYLNIIEARTGVNMTNVAKTKTELLDNLKNTVNNIGIDNINERLQQSINKNGISPLYLEQ